MNVALWIDAWINWAKYLGYDWYLRLKWLLLQVISVAFIFVVVLWLSIFMYGSFYFAYMPSVTHSRPVHLMFSSDCERDGILCSFPSANLTLSKDPERELLTRGQLYVVAVELDMPESPVNQDLGMFMVLTKFYSKHGEVVKSSSRSAILRYKSWLYQTLETLAYLPSLLLGSSEQKQRISVEMFSDYMEDAYKPAKGIFIQIQTKRIEIYSAQLRIHAKFTGLRYLLFHWPVTSAVFGVGTNMLMLMFITLLSWYGLGKGSVDAAVPELTAPPTLTSLEERRERVRALMERERRARMGSTSSTQGSQSHPHLVRHSSAPRVEMIDPATVTPSTSQVDLGAMLDTRQAQETRSHTDGGGRSHSQTGSHRDDSSEVESDEEYLTMATDQSPDTEQAGMAEQTSRPFVRHRKTQSLTS